MPTCKAARGSRSGAAGGATIERGITLEHEVGRAFLAHDWPLNIRELEQCLALGVVLAAGSAITRACLPQGIASALADGCARRSSAPPAAGGEGGLSAEDERLRSALVAALSEHGGNVSEVARAMGKARMQIQRWMKRFQLDPARFLR